MAEVDGCIYNHPLREMDLLPFIPLTVPFLLYGNILGFPCYLNLLSYCNLTCAATLDSLMSNLSLRLAPRLPCNRKVGDSQAPA